MAARNKDNARIVAMSGDMQKRESEAIFTDWNDDQFGLWLRDGSPDAMPLLDAEGRLQLVLPKIAPALLRWIDHNQEPGTADKAGDRPSPLRGVLVLSTDRGDTIEGEQEPIATFTFLEPWLESIGVPKAEIREEIFLHPGEKLESDDSPIAPAIAERIEGALRNFYDCGTASQTLVLATMGGIPQIKPLIAEIAVLLAGEKAVNIFKTERGTSGLVTLSPIDAVRVRRQCRAAVRNGALMEAAALATPFSTDPDARYWVCPLEQASLLLNGNPVGERAHLPALQALYDQAEEAASLLVAIRVETALLTKRWLEAINGTLTFLEAAFHDAINRWAKDNLKDYNPRKRYMEFKAEPNRILLEKNALSPWRGTKMPYAFQANFVGEEPLSAWGQELQIPALQDLRRAIHDMRTYVNGPKFRLADYRNFNTHGVMTQQEIDEAIRRFMGADLWSQGVNSSASRPKPGKCFLDRLW